MIRALVLALGLSLLGWAGPVLAQVVKVTSGDHEGFTRIVLTGPDLVGWQFGRTPEGYGLFLPGSPRYDVSDAFRLIGRDRLSAIWADPDGVLLQLRVSCVCHAVAFHDRPGVLVIDLRDGQAPVESAWEAGIVAGDLPALRPIPPLRPRARPDAMILHDPAFARAVQAASRVGLPAPPLPDTAVQGRSVALQAALTEELARGAARGLVDFAGRVPKPDGRSVAGAPNLRSYDAAWPGLAAMLDGGEARRLAEDGRPCLPDSQLEISSWGDGRPVWEQLAEATGGIVGEFDRPDPEGRAQAIRFLLHAGFGLEARRLIEAFPVAGQVEEDQAWVAMGAILDGEALELSTFADMAACDGRVALWALLAGPGQHATLRVDAAAVRRSFSELPPHLRRLLGPGLVTRFLDAGDPASAHEIQAAMERPGLAVPAEVATSAADLALRAGDPAGALSALRDVAATGPGAAEALAASVEAQVRMGQAVPRETVATLEVLAEERRGTPGEPALRHALILAWAATGDFERALAELSHQPDTAPTVWALLALSDDDTLLRHAVLGAPALAGPTVETRVALAGRLVDLGLGAAALAWLGEDGPDPVLAARAAFLAGDARAALRHLAGATGDEANLLRRAATARLYAPGSALPPSAGLVDPQLASWTGDWPWLAENGTDPWKAVAVLALEDGPAPPGLLARGAAALETTVATRTAIDGLLTAVSAP